MAWLHAAPKKHDNEKEPKTRLSLLTDDHPAKVLPDINSYMALCFELSGFCLDGSMGSTPLTWTEINSFSNSSGYPLNGWESEQLIKMSRSYCYMLSKGKIIGCPPPYQEGIVEMNEDDLQNMRDRVARQWDSYTSDVKIK